VHSAAWKQRRRITDVHVGSLIECVESPSCYMGVDASRDYGTKMLMIYTKAG